MDNGVGMSAEKLEYIQNLLEHSESDKKNSDMESSGIGLKNVCDRIKMIFGEEYRIEINSFENIGTIVKYRLPVVKEKEREEIHV